jgi:imidazolonepropionase-like amidohydrolase
MMYLKTVLILLVIVFATMDVFSQTPPAHALTNVKIHQTDGTMISGHLVWRNGIIEAVGNNIAIPFDAKVMDGGDSLHVYAGFIDGSATWGSPELPRRQERPARPGEPTYERAGIQPDRTASSLLDKSDRVLASVVNSGFTMAAIGLRGNMLPGSMDVFHVDGENTTNGLFKSDIGQKFQFVQSAGVYPSTLMAMMARFRQLWFDATALQEHQTLYAQHPDRYTAPKRDKVLESLYPVINKTQPLYIHVDTKDDIERIFSLQDELGFNFVLVSGKQASDVASELRRRNIAILASIDISKKPKWMTEESEEEISDELKAFRDKQKLAWEQERDNIKKLLDAGITVGYASNGFDLKDLNEKITYLTESGLTEAQINRMLTVNTASILGVSQNIGSIQRGQIASFSVRTAPFTDKDSSIKHVAVGGVIREITNNTTGRTRR